MRREHSNHLVEVFRVIRPQVNRAPRRQDAFGQGGEGIVYQSMSPMLPLGPGIGEIDMQGGDRPGRHQVP